VFFGVQAGCNPELCTWLITGQERGEKEWEEIPAGVRLFPCRVPAEVRKKATQNFAAAVISGGNSAEKGKLGRMYGVSLTLGEA